MDEEKRQDEQLALSSILEHFSIIDTLRYKVLVPYDINSNMNDADDDDVPYIHVDIRLAETYPSQSQPFVSWHPQFSWIDAKQVQKELKQCFENASGEVMLFEWIDWFTRYVCEEYQKFQETQETQNERRQTNVNANDKKPEVDWEKLFPIDAIKVSSCPIVDRKSIFKAYLTRVSTSTEALQFHGYVKQDNATATHAIMAYRIIGRNMEQDYDDDGEAQAGHRLLALLERAKCENVVVVVCRWFGGIKLGADRFRLINRCAKELLLREQYIKSGS